MTRGPTADRKQTVDSETEKAKQRAPNILTMNGQCVCLRLGEIGEKYKV